MALGHSETYDTRALGEHSGTRRVLKLSGTLGTLGRQLGTRTLRALRHLSTWALKALGHLGT